MQNYNTEQGEFYLSEIYFYFYFFTLEEHFADFILSQVALIVNLLLIMEYSSKKNLNRYSTTVHRKQINQSPSLKIFNSSNCPNLVNIWTYGDSFISTSRLPMSGKLIIVKTAHTLHNCIQYFQKQTFPSWQAQVRSMKARTRMCSKRKGLFEERF